jgi:hypothetical protein
MVGGKPLEHSDGDGIIKLSPLALSFARMKTNPTAHHREGYFLSYDSYCLTKFTLGNETNITGYIDTGGTGLATWCRHHPIARGLHLNSALGTAFNTGNTTAAPFLVPDKLSAPVPARNNKFLLWILRGNRLTQQILKGNRHTFGYPDAVPFKPQPFLLLT